MVERRRGKTAGARRGELGGGVVPDASCGQPLGGPALVPGGAATSDDRWLGSTFILHDIVHCSPPPHHVPKHLNRLFFLANPPPVLDWNASSPHPAQHTMSHLLVRRPRATPGAMSWSPHTECQ